MPYTLEQIAAAERLDCGKCDGTGESGAVSLRPCPFCDGFGFFLPPDVPALLQLIKGRKGLRSKRPEGCDRAYYVWRMARFHGGADVTMPMTASLAVAGDPYIPLLDVVADRVAERVYGTSRAGATRWANALGMELVPDPTLPASAHPGGPVVTDNNKPDSELLELV